MEYIGQMTARIEELNERFGISGSVRVEQGNGGLPRLRISTAAGAGEIYLHGAQVTSWRPAGGDEVIFLSERSHWEDGKAIRGGVPVCFPWFRGKADDPKAPAHGFARTRQWTLESVEAVDDRSVTVVCATVADDGTRHWWPNDFRVVHRITIGKTLRMELIATNIGSTTFRFEEALHSYFRVADVECVTVRGLAGISYLDNMDGNREKVQAGDLKLRGPADNAYVNTTGAADIVDPVLGRVVRTEKENSSTTVAWNPWQQGAARLADLGDDEWRGMICVEASNILSAAVSLDPGEQHTLRALVRLVDG
jgi:glucose-6-phosphate 1-epimerase